MMTTQEWAKIAARMMAWWPATKWTPEMIAVWYEDLRGYDATVVMASLERRKLDANDFAPSLGSVVAIIDSMTHPEAPPWPVAWQHISRAMRKTRYDEVEVIRMLTPIHEALAAFVQMHTVGSLAREPIDHEQYGGAVRKRLEDSYNDVVRRVREAGKVGRALEAVERRGELGAGTGPHKIDAGSLLGLPSGG